MMTVFFLMYLLSFYLYVLTIRCVTYSSYSSVIAMHSRFALIPAPYPPLSPCDVFITNCLQTCIVSCMSISSPTRLIMSANISHSYLTTYHHNTTPCSEFTSNLQGKNRVYIYKQEDHKEARSEGQCVFIVSLSYGDSCVLAGARLSYTLPSLTNTHRKEWLERASSY